MYSENKNKVNKLLSGVDTSSMSNRDLINYEFLNLINSNVNVIHSSEFQNVSSNFNRKLNDIYSSVL